MVATALACFLATTVSAQPATPPHLAQAWQAQQEAQLGYSEEYTTMSHGPEAQGEFSPGFMPYTDVYNLQ